MDQAAALRADRLSDGLVRLVRLLQGWGPAAAAATLLDAQTSSGQRLLAVYVALSDEGYVMLLLASDEVGLGGLL